MGAKASTPWPGIPREELSDHEACVGENHPLVAQTHNNMANVYRNQGKYALALEFHEKSLAIKACVGENHLSVAQTYMGMAKFYDEQKRFVEARDYFSRAKTIFTKTHGDRYTR